MVALINLLMNMMQWRTVYVAFVKGSHISHSFCVRRNLLSTQPNLIWFVQCACICKNLLQNCLNKVLREIKLPQDYKKDTFIESLVSKRGKKRFLLTKNTECGEASGVVHIIYCMLFHYKTAEE